jgi:hypothetical protein
MVETPAFYNTYANLIVPATGLQKVHVSDRNSFTL